MPETTITETAKPLNGRIAPPRTARVVGLGHKLPDRVVSNGPIAERIGVDSDWIVRRTGIRERRYAAPDERTADLALAAARRALSDAGLKPADIDLVLVATSGAVLGVSSSGVIVATRTRSISDGFRPASWSARLAAVVARSLVRSPGAA